MVVALCLSGLSRNYQKTYPALKKYFLDNNEVDIFFHTWDVQDRNQQPVDKVRLIEIYQAKSYTMEPPINFQFPELYHQRNFNMRDINGLLSMFYSIKQSNFLKNKTGKKYDQVVRCRFDIEFMEPLILQDNTDQQHLNIPMYGDFGGLNDQFAYGSASVMDQYSNVYDNINSYLMEGLILNPEYLMKRHNKNIIVNRFSFNYQYHSHNKIWNNHTKEKLFGFK